MLQPEDIASDRLGKLSLSSNQEESSSFGNEQSHEENKSLQNLDECNDDWLKSANDIDDKDIDVVASESGLEKSVIKKRVIENKKEPVSIVFCGHVDAGKSTIGGQLMYLTGMIDKRTLEKYEKEAKEKNRESWYLSWALDINEEERSKGKTVEVGRAFFETEKRHYIMLDAPGHKCFVPNMIGGASQADIAILVVSARKGEFETGFDRGGQTREHAMLVKTAGVKLMIVLVNKMDDPTTDWSKERYDYIVEKLTPYLKKCGYQSNRDLVFIPCSGMTGAYLKDKTLNLASWYSGPSFIEYLDSLPPMSRNTDAPFRMPI